LQRIHFAIEKLELGEILFQFSVVFQATSREDIRHQQKEKKGKRK
jgi:hypothetical protein